MTNIITGIIRHFLTTVGGGIGAGAVITDNEIGLITGALVTILGVVWSIVEKIIRDRVNA